MITLTLAEKLEFLWNDFIEFVNDGVKENKYPKEILNNFDLVDKSQINEFNENAKSLPSCSDCKNNCCSRIDGKVLLKLKDVAVLVDNGHESAIEGSFRGFANLLADYQENKDLKVFNNVNILMQDMLNDQYMPYLKKIGSTCVFLDESGSCKIYNIRPIACKSYPYGYDLVQKKIIWSDSCHLKGTNMSEEDKEQIIFEMIEQENERIKDISLIMLNNENLAKIGFRSYL